MGDLGGVFELTYTLFSFFIWPISEFIFHLRTLKRLFDVKTSDTDLFQQPDQKVHPEIQTNEQKNSSQVNILSMTQQSDIKTDRTKDSEGQKPTLIKGIDIKLSESTKLKMFLIQRLGKCFP